MLTRAGKSTTIAPMVATPSLPCPKISSSTGAMATSGTERSSIAIGMNANSNGFTTTNSAAITLATTSPVTKPIAASPTVTSHASSSCERAASAVRFDARTARGGASLNR